MRQISFLNFKPSLTYGGSQSVGKKHIMRPLCSRQALHLVLKAQNISHRFKGIKLTQAQTLISQILEEKAQRHGIKIYSHSVNSDHMHVVLRIKKRADYVRFIRAMTAHIVKRLSRFFGFNLSGLFDLSPWTRVVSWGRAFKTVIKYIELNKLEAQGLISRLYPARHKNKALCLRQKQKKLK